jgi:hypothetical protein
VSVDVVKRDVMALLDKKWEDEKHKEQDLWKNTTGLSQPWANITMHAVEKEANQARVRSKARGNHMIHHAFQVLIREGGACSSVRVRGKEEEITSPCIIIKYSNDLRSIQKDYSLVSTSKKSRT